MLKDTRSRNKYFKSSSIHSYLKAYAAEIRRGLNKIDRKEMQKCQALFIKAKRRIFVGGNGGSAAISDHLCCDMEKGADLPVHSLVGSTALLTAIGNDLGYKETLVFPLIKHRLSKKDIVILISSSGSSPNIIEAAHFAKIRGATLVGLTGFSGGTLRALADIKIHVPVHNYGVVEDCHQAVMHILAQWRYLKGSK